MKLEEAIELLRSFCISIHEALASLDRNGDMGAGGANER